VGPLIIIMLIVFVGYVVTFIVRLALNSLIHGFFGLVVLGALGVLLSLVVGGILQLGLWRSGLAITAGEPVEPAKMFSTDLLGPYIIATILFSVMVGVGTLFCFIPGLVLFFFGFFYPYYVLEQRQGPTEAIKSSFQLVSNNLAILIPFAVVVWLVYIAGAIVCGVGLLVSAPVAIIATAYAYRVLNNQPVAP